MIHKTVVVGPFQCNCILLGCEKTKDAVLIDPGDEPQSILSMIEASGLNVKYLLHTHAHLDHINATKDVRAKINAPPCLHEQDRLLYENLPMQGKLFGFDLQPAPPIEKFILDEEILEFGEHRLQVLHTPGHSPGSVCYRLLGGDEAVFSGDTLFQGSVGRSDLWGGDHGLLIRSIKNRLLPLDGDTQVHPGHGPSSSIGEEKHSNPFLS